MLAMPALAAAPAAEQILKCTDGLGNVTYQNEPCPKAMKAGRVEIFENSWTTDRVEKEAEWRRNAAEHRVVAGMPLRFVREALGEPAEVRDTATAGAAEVWLYNFPERSIQVGVLNNQVLWFRETPVAAAVARVAPAPERAVPDRAQPAPQVTRVAPAPERPSPELPITRLAPPAPESVSRDAAPAPDRPAPELPITRMAPPPSEAASRDASPPPDTSRAAPDAAMTAPTIAKAPAPARTVARGQDCKQAIASLGPPDRQREVAAIDAASDPSTEYFYEPSGIVGATRTRVVCANGKVEGVDRAVIR
jgi:hypothetical protein